MSPAPSIGLNYSHVMGGLSFVNIGPTVVKLKDILKIFDHEPFVAFTRFTYLFWKKMRNVISVSKLAYTTFWTTLKYNCFDFFNSQDKAPILVWAKNQPFLASILPLSNVCQIPPSIIKTKVA